MADTLAYVDIGFYACGAVLMAVALGRWVRRMRSVRLEDWPQRPHHLTGEMLLVPLGLYLVFAFVLQAGMAAWPPAKGSETAMAQAGSLLQLFGLAACWWVGHQAFAGGLSVFLFGRVSWGEAIGRSLAYFLATMAACAGVLWITQSLITLIQPDYSFPQHQTLEALSREAPSIVAQVGLYLGAALIAPITEESFFRGLLQSLSGNVLRSRWSAVVVTAIAFGLIHARQPHAVPALIVFGLILGYAYEKSGALIVPILLHALFNARTLLWHGLMRLDAGG